MSSTRTTRKRGRRGDGATATANAGGAVITGTDDEDSAVSQTGATSIAGLNGVAETGANEGEAEPEEAPLPDDDREEQLADRLGLRFKDPALLRLALTHRSVLHDWKQAGPGLPPMQSNERLEFLGDALLGAIVAEHLYERYPNVDEGTLTRRRVALVRAETLVRWAREIDLGSALYLGVGERITAGARDRMLAGAFEALVGAIARDRGLREAKRFVRRFLKRDIEAIIEQEVEANPKGALQEFLQERYRLAPVYRTVATEGPAHARVFIVEVSMEGRSLGRGSGASKREAQQAAARVALETVREERGARSEEWGAGGGEWGARNEERGAVGGDRGARSAPLPQAPSPNNEGRGERPSPPGPLSLNEGEGERAGGEMSSPPPPLGRIPSGWQVGEKAEPSLPAPRSSLPVPGPEATPTPTSQAKRKRTRRKRGEA